MSNKMLSTWLHYQITHENSPKPQFSIFNSTDFTTPVHNMLVFASSRNFKRNFRCRGEPKTLQFESRVTKLIWLITIFQINSYFMWYHEQQRGDESMEKGCINFIIEPFHFLLHIQARRWNFLHNFNWFSTPFMFFPERRKKSQFKATHENCSYLLWLNLKNFWCDTYRT